MGIYSYCTSQEECSLQTLLETRPFARHFQAGAIPFRRVGRELYEAVFV